MITQTAAVLLALANAAWASARPIDDSDLSGPTPASALSAEAKRSAEALVFLISQPKPARSTAQPMVRAVLTLDGRPGRLASAKLVGPGASQPWTVADHGGRFAIPTDGRSGSFRLRVSLDNPYWSFQSQTGDRYEWESGLFVLAPGSGADLGAISLPDGTENAKLGALHLTYLEALDFLRREADASWWTRPLTIHWPGAGDFFSPAAWSIDLTNPKAWDVDLHELGHAVMDGALGAPGVGGQHKIDECYSPELAWSEGWATFFAGAVRLDRADADARFQYLVPRRAPIRIENVPIDVCQGSASEWRVAAALWDLIDTHGDGLDRFSMPFSELWSALRGSRPRTVLDAWKRIESRLGAADRAPARDALAQNTVIARPTSRPPRLPAVMPPWPSPGMGANSQAH